MRTMILTGFAAVTLAGCGGSEESRVYDESEADQAAAAIARGEQDVTIRSQEGDEVRIRTGDSGGALPGDMPVYPGANRTGGYSANSTGADGGSGQIVAFSTADSPAEVIAFYRERIEDSGRDVAATMDMGQMQSITVSDSDNRGGFTITATDTGSGTSITIAGGRSGG
ncbi:MAG: hypothetical protein ABR601_10895 [Parasphingopyxis sp.]